MASAIMSMILALTSLVGLHSAAQVPALPQAYTNAVFHFSLMMPADFTASDTGHPVSSKGGAIVLQDRIYGIQITVTPDPTAADDTLTIKSLEQEYPYMAIHYAQPIQVAPGIIGIAFEDANSAAPGLTSEVWFSNARYLYQILSHAGSEALLRTMISTWKFN